MPCKFHLYLGFYILYLNISKAIKTKKLRYKVTNTQGYL